MTLQHIPNTCMLKPFSAEIFVLQIFILKRLWVGGQMEEQKHKLRSKIFYKKLLIAKVLIMFGGADNSVR